MARADMERPIDDAAAFDQLIAAGLIRVDDEAQTAIMVRPKLIAAFNEIRAYKPMSEL
jgi:hypothetical protein